MFRYIATLPPSNLAIANGSVTIEQNSFILNDGGLPIYYQFHLICTDFADYCNQKNVKGDKNFILLTIHTKDNPVTANVLASNFTSFMNVFNSSNQIKNFNLQITGQKEATFSSVKEASVYIRQYFSERSSNFLNMITTIKITAKRTFTWFITPFTDTQEKSPPNNFIFSLKGAHNINSPEFEEFKSLIPHSIILINYRFSLSAPFKFIKHLLKLNVIFENHSVDPQKTKHTKSPAQSSKEADEDENLTPKKDFEFDPNWDWKEFIKKKDYKGFIRDMNEKKRIERELLQKNKTLPSDINKNFQTTQKPDKIDKQRLVYVAQKAAISKNVPIDTMDEILNELDTQIAHLTQFESKANKEFEELGMLYSYYVKKKKKATEKYEEKRREYGKVHKELENKLTVKRDEKIGFDDDVDFTIEILNEEIETIQKDINYLKVAFSDEDQKEDIEKEDNEKDDEKEKEEEEEEEEEEIEEIEVIEEEEEESNENGQPQELNKDDLEGNEEKEDLKEEEIANND